LTFSEKWQSKEFRDVIDKFSSGATPYRGNSEFYKGKIRWISSGELNYNYITDTIEKISEDAKKKSNLQLHPKGTFLMAITGLEAETTRGRCAIIGKPSTTNQSCMALYPKDNLSVEFLFYYYRLKGNELAFKYCQGTKQQSYTAHIVKRLPIKIPPTKEEQFTITKILSGTDELIQQLDYLITKKKNIKQGTMQELLTGKRRLEGFNEKWKEKILPNIGKIISGGTPSSLKKEYWNGDILWAVPTDITKLTNNYIEDTERKITSIGLQESSSELLPIGTILITSRATIGECAIAKKPICTNQGFQNLVCNNKFDNIFIFYSILQNKKKLNEFTAGSTFKEISKKQMEKISILVPIDISEQQEISRILSDMDSEIEQLETKRDKYVMIKNGMMQKLLTGEIRLT